MQQGKDMGILDHWFLDGDHLTLLKIQMHHVLTILYSR